MNTDWGALDLPGLPSEIWRLLEQGVRTVGHPWRTPVLATDGDAGGARVVVLRRVDAEAGVLEFHTDARSPKVEALRRSPRVTCVFYSAETQVQVRIRALAAVHINDAVAASAWERVPKGSRGNYTTDLPPGTVLDRPGFEHDFRDAMTHHFALIRCRVESLDWLWLAGPGHRRAQWTRDGEGWRGHWVMP